MFQVSSEKIDIEAAKGLLMDSECGGFVTFEGWVRNHNDGFPVDRLEYEVYQALALKEGRKIIDEALSLFEIENATVIHREGLLEIGDIAVWIGVSSKHRDAAYRASRYLIDEIKSRLPIWKKEHYSDGRKEWVNCHGCLHHHSLHFSKDEYYSKQLTLVGTRAQNRLSESKVLVVGAGGLGSSVLPYLAGAGIGEIVVMDHDRLEASNLSRQVIYDYKDVGHSKAELAQKRLQEINPFIVVKSLARPFRKEDERELLKDVDLVVECSDNFSTKFMVHDACYEAKIPLVIASVYKWEGWLQCFSFEGETPCLRCLYPEQPLDGCTLNCEEAGIVGTVPGLLGVAQAQMAIDYLCQNQFATEGRKTLFDVRSLRTRSIGVPKNPACLCCGTEKNVEPVNYLPENEIERDWTYLSKIMERVDPPFIVDIRNENEKEFAVKISNWDILEMPVKDISSIRRFSKDTEIYLVCARGRRSLEQASVLRDQGYANVFSVKGGMAAIRM